MGCFLTSVRPILDSDRLRAKVEEPAIGSESMIFRLDKFTEMHGSRQGEPGRGIFHAAETSVERRPSPRT